MSNKNEALLRRKARVRRALKATANGRPRLSVFRSSKQIYVQVIDDAAGRTLAAASSLDKDLKASLKTGADKAAARPWASSSPSAPRLRVSPRSSSTARATSSTAA